MGFLRDKTRKPGKAPLSAKTGREGAGVDLLGTAGAKPPIGPAARWPRRSTFRFAPSSAWGTHIVSNPIACARSNGPAIPLERLQIVVAKTVCREFGR